MSDFDKHFEGGKVNMALSVSGGGPTLKECFLVLADVVGMTMLFVFLGYALLG